MDERGTIGVYETISQGETNYHVKVCFKGRVYRSKTSTTSISVVAMRCAKLLTNIGFPDSWDPDVFDNYYVIVA